MLFYFLEKLALNWVMACPFIRPRHAFKIFMSEAGKKEQINAAKWIIGFI